VRHFVLALAAGLVACATHARNAPADAAPKAPPPPDAGPPMPAHVDPPAEPGAPHATALGLGGDFACARMSDDTMRCWGGGNDWGQLGNGQTGEVKTVVTPALGGVVQIAVGWNFTCARLRDGTVRCFGYNGQEQIGVPPAGDAVTAFTKVPGLDHVVDVSAGLVSTCAARDDGSVWCWGRNDAGVLGDGSKDPMRGPVLVKGLSRAVEVAVGGFACARRDDGSVWCWGSNQGRTPAPVAGLADVEQIAVGGLTACARLGDGTLRCWGQNDSGQLARGDASDGKDEIFDEPAPVVGVRGATRVVASSSHACALADRKLWCWGAVWANPGFPAACLHDTAHHGGGGGPVQWKYCATPTVVAGVKDPLAVAVGPQAVCAATRSGDVFCWEGFEPELKKTSLAAK
jgi:alpha-tubulin suppressor-like RCC1 family protein